MKLFFCFLFLSNSLLQAQETVTTYDVVRLTGSGPLLLKTTVVSYSQIDAAFLDNRIESADKSKDDAISEADNWSFLRLKYDTMVGADSRLRVVEKPILPPTIPPKDSVIQKPTKPKPKGRRKGK